MKKALFAAVIIGLAAATIDSAARAQGSTGPTHPPAPTGGGGQSGTPSNVVTPGASPPSSIPPPNVATNPSRDIDRRPPVPRSGLNSDPYNPSGAPGSGVGLGTSGTR